MVNAVVNGCSAHLPSSSATPPSLRVLIKMPSFSIPTSAPTPIPMMLRPRPPSPAAEAEAEAAAETLHNYTQPPPPPRHHHKYFFVTV